MIKQLATGSHRESATTVTFAAALTVVVPPPLVLLPSSPLLVPCVDLTLTGEECSGSHGFLIGFSASTMSVPVLLTTPTVGPALPYSDPEVSV